MHHAYLKCLFCKTIFELKSRIASNTFPSLLNDIYLKNDNNVAKVIVNIQELRQCAYYSLFLVNWGYTKLINFN